MKVTQSIDGFTDYLLHVKGYSPNTVRAYATDLQSFYDFADCDDSDDIEPVLTLQTARRWLADLTRSGLSRATLARRGSSIRKYSHWLYTTHQTHDDFAARLSTPTPDNTLPRVWTIDEMKKFFATCQQQARELKDPIAVRDWAVFELLYATGIRVSELCGMDLHDIDEENRMITVMGKGSKERRVPFGVPALRAVELYRDTARQALLVDTTEQALFLGARGKRLSDRQVRSSLRKTCIAAHVPVISPHGLRHAAATHMLQGGADLRMVQEILGHESLDTTQRYTHVDRQRLAAAFLQAHPHA